MLVIVDYGVGNAGSILNMLKKVGQTAILTSDPAAIEKASKIILPGVGAFDYGMEKLHDTGLVPVLNQKAKEEKIPVLGICLGMQLFAMRSDEGSRAGLGWVDAECVKFRFQADQPGQERTKVPHMGWNDVKIVRQGGVFTDMYEEPRFYFVHSYYLKCNHPEDVVATTQYGFEFCSAVRSENIQGVQFHPEKSHKYGMRILHNFASA
jgi:imidazole glycerol-phosphate synthase subunit HisH